MVVWVLIQTKSDHNYKQENKWIINSFSAHITLYICWNSKIICSFVSLHSWCCRKPKKILLHKQCNFSNFNWVFKIKQVNEKSFDLKEGIQGWYKKEGDKTGMNGCMLPWWWPLNSNNQQAHALIYCHVDYLVCCDNIGHVPVDC